MVPEELMEFFKVKGRILLIEGDAGTGKTLLGFKLLNEMRALGEVICVNSRDMDSADISELEEIVPKNSRINASPKKVTNNVIDENVESPIEETIESHIDMLKVLYHEIQELKGSTVVIDSFDGLATDLRNGEKEHLRIKLVR